ncbi:TPA: hypothetical protein ACSW2J_004298 [Escherichia coli]|uniref:hypothetical protein n=1 Tax=Escherichia coli TaxID=562 RepID=UPI00069471D4|nr:hypothetical protein [Escherichia coli]ANV92245.1 hypothetical protein BB344_00020 [Escherichia coli]ANV96894.1 hypothetical protein BB344_25445 [Escherichia coli]EAC1560578.1 hypothetical protein [Escherichia coli]EEV9001195.1 hypothetical protein [Escherichia coli]EEW6022580.1 hypothetical protein [Escherichia coli]
MSTGNPKSVAPTDDQKEWIERAKFVFDYQQKQYEFALTSLRRLEDKATKIFGSINVILTISMLIVRYWDSYIFVSEITPPRVLCWLSLALFFVFFLISWGFVFSAMQPREGMRPATDASIIDFFMGNPRQNSMSSFASSYTDFIDKLDEVHKEKVAVIQKGSEAMLFGAWSFIIFLISFLLIRFT